MKISVITPTIRSVSLNRICLGRQTFKDFEWIVVRPKGKTPKGLCWTFNRDMNRALRKAKGELVVSYQDMIWIPDDGLQKFWDNWQAVGPKACISGVGHIYDKMDHKPYHQVWADPRIRMDQGSFYECMPNDCEMNWSCWPREAFFEIGGFDEEYDKYFGMDNVNIATRLDKKGYKFYLDQTNECRGLKHKRPKDWDKKHAMHGFHQRRLAETLDKKLNYLVK